VTHFGPLFTLQPVGCEPLPQERRTNPFFTSSVPLRPITSPSSRQVDLGNRIAVRCSVESSSLTVRPVVRLIPVACWCCSLDLLKDRYVSDRPVSRRVSSSSREASPERYNLEYGGTKLSYSADASRNATPSTQSSNPDQEYEVGGAVPLKLGPPGADSTPEEAVGIGNLKASPIAAGRPGLLPLRCLDVPRSPQEGGSPGHGYRLASPILSPSASRKAQSRLKLTFAEYSERSPQVHGLREAHEPDSLLERAPSSTRDVRFACCFQGL
jgi:hypothetical protein